LVPGVGERHIAAREAEANAAEAERQRLIDAAGAAEIPIPDEIVIIEQGNNAPAGDEPVTGNENLEQRGSAG